MFFKVFPKAFLEIKNCQCPLSGLDFNVLHGLCFLINRRNNFKFSSAQQYAGTHTFRLYEFTSLLYRHLKPTTAKARVLKSLDHLSKADLIHVTVNKEHNSVTLELTTETVESIMPKGESWFSFPFEFFEDPSSLSSLNLDSSELQKHMHGHDLIFLMCLVSIFTEQLLQQSSSEIECSESDESLISKWREMRQSLLQYSGNVCTESDDVKLKQQKNTISHRFYRALRRLKELGFIDFSEIKTKGKQIMAIVNLALNSKLRDMITELNRKRINAYKAAIHRAEFSKMASNKNATKQGRMLNAAKITSPFQAEQPRMLFTAQSQP